MTFRGFIERDSGVWIAHMEIQDISNWVVEDVVKGGLVDRHSHGISRLGKAVTIRPLALDAALRETFATKDGNLPRTLRRCACRGRLIDRRLRTDPGVDEGVQSVDQDVGHNDEARRDENSPLHDRAVLAENGLHHRPA